MVILENELDGNESFIYRFSDPDGVRTGKSGYSFGQCQFDTQNNDQALACLVDCGFTHDEIDGIVHQTINVVPLAARLIAHKEIVAKYDEAQLSHCINSAVNFCETYKLPVTDTAALLMLADTINQVGSVGASTAKYLSGLNRPVEAHDILTYKLTWKYATDSKRGYEDFERRYQNIIKVVQTNKGE